MIGRNTLKRACKRLAGGLAALTSPLVPRPGLTRASILMYHRVADIGRVDPHLDDWNIAPSRFERHIAALASRVEFVPLLDLPARLSAPADRPLVCVTFDDGFAGVCTHALPVLQKYGVPATVFLVTQYVGQAGPMPFDRWGLKYRDRVSPEAWRPLSWAQVEGCLAGGLVTVGSHSHHHWDARRCTPPQLAEEAARSKAILAARLGPASTRAYAYPYGSSRLGQASPAYVQAVRNAGYELAVCTDLGLARPDHDACLLPRVEAVATDSPAVLHAKTRGALWPYYFTDRLRGYFARPIDRHPPRVPRWESSVIRFEPEERPSCPTNP